jgi:hypothetical protein
MNAEVRMRNSKMEDGKWKMEKGKGRRPRGRIKN